MALKIERFYYLTTHSSCKLSCDYCPCLGCLSPQPLSIEKISKRVSFAKKRQYATILFPCNVVFQENIEEILSLCKKQKMKAFVQVHLNTPIDTLVEIKKKLQSGSFGVNCIIDSYGKGDIDKLFLLKSDSWETYYTIIGRKSCSPEILIHKLPSFVVNKLYFYFPYHTKNKNDFFIEDEIFLLLEKIKRQYPEIIPLPQRGIPLHDCRKTQKKELFSLRDLFRNTLQPKLYMANQAKMGDYVLVRKASAAVFKYPLLYPLKPLFLAIGCLSRLAIAPKCAIHSLYCFIFSAIYPIRKIYYFSSYQWKKRILKTIF